MNATLKNIITNPFVICGTAVGVGITAGAVIYATHRPKTDAEIELEKQKEANAEAERQRQHERDMEKAKARAAADEVEAQEKTKRDAKHEEEITRRLELEIQKAKEQREWEKIAPDGYWRVKEAQAKASSEEAAAKRESETQREIARLQADAARYSAEQNAKAIKDKANYEYLRSNSQNNADVAKAQALYGGIANIVTGVTGKNS